MKNILKLSGTTCLALIGACALTSQAQVLYTTQQDFSAATSASGANITVGPPVGAPDTDGSGINGLASPAGPGTPGSLYLVENVLGYQQANLGGQAGNAAFLAALKGHTMLSLDYVLPQDIVRGSGGYFEIWMVFNWSGGYQQINNNAFFGSSANLLAGTHTVTYDYSALQPGLPTSAPGYFEVFVVLNSGGTLTPASNIPVYIDNITAFQAVPEPATFTLVGLGALGVMMLRRRKA
jgi:PEP-CTERM motif